MKLYRLRGRAKDVVRGWETFFGTVLMGDYQNETAAKKVFSAQLRANSDVDVTKIEYDSVGVVEDGFVFATHHRIITK